MANIFLIGIIIVVIGGVGAAAYFVGGYGSANYSLPALPQSGGSLPQSVSQALSSSSGELQGLSALSSNSLARESQFHVFYAGSLSVKPGGGYSLLPSFTSPLYARQYKYNGTSSKIEFNISSVPVMGPADLQYSSVPPGGQVCADFNISEADAGNIGALLTGSHGEDCQGGSSIAGIDLAPLASFNLTALQGMGFVFKYGSSYQSVVDGMNCSAVTGSLFQEGANGNDTGSGSYETCISDTYYVPLMFGFTLQGSGGSELAVLNATDMGPSS